MDDEEFDWFTDPNRRTADDDLYENWPDNAADEL
jgi:hypothetical protein